MKDSSGGCWGIEVLQAHDQMGCDAAMSSGLAHRSHRHAEAAALAAGVRLDLGILHRVVILVTAQDKSGVRSCGMGVINKGLPTDAAYP